MQDETDEEDIITTFYMSKEAYDEFLALLEEPPRKMPKLAALLRSKLPWTDKKDNE